MDRVKTFFLDDAQLPLVIEPTSNFSTKEQVFDFLQENQNHLKELLLKHGGLLFRGFPLQDAEDFSACIKNLGTGQALDYIGGDSPRNKINNEGVYTSTEAPPSFKILLHNELSFVKHFPRHIYFFCETASPEGGETIIADCRKIYQSVDISVKERFVSKRLRYVSCYYHQSLLMEMLNRCQRSHKSWIQVFETDSKQEVERKCREHEFDFQWKKDGWLQISQTRPAVMAHPVSGEGVWFNQAHLYDFNPRLLGLWRYLGAKLFYCREHTKLHQIFFADHTPISRHDLYHVMDVLDEHTIAFLWQRGDFLVLDNVLTMHGRAPFKGKRRILAAMTG
jgi:alpha-ketoglutarate-dependent taurine dioxygenase